MTEQNFSLAFAALLNAFPNSVERVTGETRDIYWKALREIPDDLWDLGIRKCLRDYQFFPTIREIGTACCGEQKEQTIWKTDPWRERQHYAEHLPEITWHQNLRQILDERGAIAAPRERRRIRDRKILDIRADPVHMRDVLKETIQKINVICGRRGEKEKGG